MSRILPLCECGCGDPARFAYRHVRRSIRLRLTSDDFTVEDRGYETPCWIWQRKKGSNYGMVRLGGREIYAHRAMYEQEVGPIPEGLSLDHLCRVPPCVNPAHLDPVTQAENTRRGKGAKLTHENVRAIRTSDEAVTVLAHRFDVSASLIYLVRKHRIWKGV